jgi:hypothetical protein
LGVKKEDPYVEARIPRYSKSKAQEFLDVSARTFNRYLKNGLLFGERLPSGELRFRLDELLKLLQPANEPHSKVRVAEAMRARKRAKRTVPVPAEKEV